VEVYGFRNNCPLYTQSQAAERELAEAKKAAEAATSGGDWTVVEKAYSPPVPVPTDPNAPVVATRDTQKIALNEHMGAVIGKGGANIKEIQERSGAKVDIEKGTGSKTATVSGTVDEVANAISQIRAIMGERDEVAANTVTEELVVDRKKHSLVIGKGGSQIQEIQATSGARVIVPKRDEETDTISVRGTKSEVADAIRMIKEAIADIVPVRLLPVVAVHNARAIPHLPAHCTFS
jgi:polyribonucleotide nucleotidyltransferase